MLRQHGQFRRAVGLAVDVVTLTVAVMPVPIAYRRFVGGWLGCS